MHRYCAASAVLLALAGIPVANAAANKRVATRLVNQYIKGSTLVLLKQLFRYAAVNETSTRSLANRAIKFYDTRPRGKR